MAAQAPRPGRGCDAGQTRPDQLPTCARSPEAWTILASLIGAARISPGACLDCRGSQAAVYEKCHGTGSRAGAGLAGSVR